MNYQTYRPMGFGLLPPVVKNLLILNGLAFLVTFVCNEVFQYDITASFALYPWNSEKFEIYQLVTYLFLHAGFAHILFNMFALWMFGNALENLWGGKRFLIFYLITGIGAGIIHLLYTAYQVNDIKVAAEAYMNTPSFAAFELFVEEHVPSVYLLSFNELLDVWRYDTDNYNYAENSVSLIRELLNIKDGIPTVGASGAVFGLLLAFGMMFPDSVIYLYFAIPIKAKYFVILYGVLELYAGVQNNPTDNIAHFAHLGGMLFGFFLIKYWQNR